MHPVGANTCPPAQHPAIAQVISASPLTGMFRPICDVTVVVGFFFFFFPKVNLLSKLNLSLRHILSLPPLLGSSFSIGAVRFLVLLQRLKIERIGRVFQASKNAACTSVSSSLTFLKNWHSSFRRKSGLSHKFMQCFSGLHTRAPPLQSSLSPRFALDHFSQAQPVCLKASAQQDKCSSMLKCDFSSCPGFYFIWE